MSELFSGGGAAAAAMRAVDWSRNALGTTERWPYALKAHVQAMLHTRQPICIFWGKELVNLYNDAFIPILGDKHATAMGQAATVCWADAWPVIGNQIESVMRGESVLHEEMLVPIARQGVLEDAWWNYSYSPLYGDDGDVGGVLVICTEITREVVARRALEAAKHAAEHGREQAEAANRAKDDFLATVSHELRTPLTAILGWARILAEGANEADTKKGLDVIERNARAQVKLVDDILDVARIVSGKLELSIEKVDAARVILAAIESARPSAQNKRLRLEVEVGIDRTTRIDADEPRLQQIVSNLLANAVKFTPSGGTICVRAAERDGMLALTVADTGRGISPEFLPHVFDRFRQDDVSTTRQNSGLGLGLAIVRHLVELHGGTVSAQSAGDGHGATFIVTLPLVRAARGPASVASAPSVRSLGDAAESVSAGKLAGACVLVVDDHDDARELVGVVLESAGAKVIEASSVARALEILASTKVSAVVSDIGMPGEDGYELAERLRASPDTRDIPAIALTAFARSEDRVRALSSGFRGHVAKPIDPNALVETVAALLRCHG